MLIALALGCGPQGAGGSDAGPFRHGSLGVRATIDEGVSPWFVRTSRGFQHGWVLDAAPPGATVAVSLTGAEVRSLSPSRARVVADDGQAWLVERLRAFDATGRDLPVVWSATPDGFAIELDVTSAVVPIVVDPVWSAIAFVDFGSAAPADGGLTAGDVDGDGHVDLVAVVSDLAAMRADIRVYPGTGAGFGATPWVIPSAVAIGAGRGITGSYVGDVDRDGFGDVVLGEWAHPSGAGSVRLHGGGPAGPDPAGVPLPTAATERAGAFMTALGDLNMDGYADFGSSGWAVTMGSPFEVFYGGSGGPTPTPVMSTLLWGIGFAGDVNGDGQKDLVVHHDTTSVSVYLGSMLGLGASPAQTLAHDALLQDVVDLDGDGYADLLFHNHPDTTEIFYGAPSLFGATPDATFVSPGLDMRYQAVAGDTDGDGALEVVVVHDGEVTLHRGDDLAVVTRTLDHGYGGGTYGETDLVARLGDIDGDGTDDLAIAEPLEGAWIYLGFVDQDGDGVAEADDCDDADAGVGLPGPGWADLDGDGYGDPATFVVDCAAVENALDCDDSAATVAPDAMEVCNDIDDDCDLLIDEDPPVWYRDEDGDGFGTDLRPVTMCTPGEGYVLATGDCDDLDPGAWPGAPESCDGVDTDCDGAVDDVTCDTSPPRGSVSLVATAREGGGTVWFRTGVIRPWVPGLT